MIIFRQTQIEAHVRNVNKIVKYTGNVNCRFWAVELFLFSVQKVLRFDYIISRYVKLKIGNSQIIK